MKTTASDLESDSLQGSLQQTTYMIWNPSDDDDEQPTMKPPVAYNL